jgi:predicted transcriptional regulator
MRDRPALGDQELALLRFLAERSPIAVREVVSEYGEANGLARTTVLTMLERLRKKGFLHRSRTDGVFQYTVASEQSDVLHDIVESFVQKTLGGSLTPFVAYLTQSKNLRREELDALRKVIEDADHTKQGPDEH